jgi:hypothetical protein
MEPKPKNKFGPKIEYYLWAHRECYVNEPGFRVKGDFIYFDGITDPYHKDQLYDMAQVLLKRSIIMKKKREREKKVKENKRKRLMEDKQLGTKKKKIGKGRYSANKKSTF